LALKRFASTLVFPYFVTMKLFYIVVALFAFTTLEAQPPGFKIPDTHPYYLPPPPPLPWPWPNDGPNPWHLQKRQKTEVDRTHSFVINLKDSTQLLVEGMIMYDSNGYYFTWTDKTMKRSDSGRTKRINPSQTFSLVRWDSTTSAQFEGVAVGSAWLFTAVAGKLTVYTTATEDDLPDESLLYIRKDNGPIQNLNEDLLKQLLRGNIKAVQLLNKGKIKKAIEQYNKGAGSADK
jgi:hypothetical protein